jgi:hypothetical protein
VDLGSGGQGECLLAGEDECYVNILAKGVGLHTVEVLINGSQVIIVSATSESTATVAV